MDARHNDAAEQVVAALPIPILLVGDHLAVLFVNPAAEQFFATGAALLTKRRLNEFLPIGCPIFSLISQARDRNASVSERELDLSALHHGPKVADVTVTPVSAIEGIVMITLQERGAAMRLDRQLLHRGTARSLHGMAAVLAHEIKNPLAGIRGAAQLLEGSLGDGDRQLTQLICQESDRIRGLVDSMEAFGDSRGMPRSPVNIHEVLARVRKIAETGFARHVAFAEVFDPSLPVALGDRNQLIQVFLNLVRNASDALGETGGEIGLITGYRPGMRVRAGGSSLDLPLEVIVRDDGPGVPPDVLPHIFDPFVTTKRGGSGLGLALAAKIVSDHGGSIECESVPRRTLFRVLLPKVEESIP